MEKFWEKAITVTGPVAVVGFVFAQFINMAFKESVLSLFGNTNAFYLSVAIVCFLGSALIISILLYRSNKSTPSQEIKMSGENKSATISKSTIKGDVVFGDKTVNKGKARDE